MSIISNRASKWLYLEACNVLIFNHFKSKKKLNDITDKKVATYISYIEDAFLIEKAERFDIKGKAYIDSPFKYYFQDMGIRNCVLSFRQLEETHMMENVIYNELKVRGFQVDVGVVPVRIKDENGNIVRRQSAITSSRPGECRMNQRRSRKAAHCVQSVIPSRRLSSPGIMFSLNVTRAESPSFPLSSS